jgi:hypothetical protein
LEEGRRCWSWSKTRGFRDGRASSGRGKLLHRFVVDRLVLAAGYIVDHIARLANLAHPIFQYGHRRPVSAGLASSMGIEVGSPKMRGGVVIGAVSLLCDARLAFRQGNDGLWCVRGLILRFRTNPSPHKSGMLGVGVPP